MKKQILITALTCSLAFAPILGGVAGAKQFSDVNNNHYAFRPVAKLSAMGVISGRGQGIFAPSDPVTNLEALVMVLRFKGLGSVADTSSSLFTPIDDLRFGGNVPNWGKGYFVTASQQNLLSADEKPIWNAGASRAWVAKVLVKMLGRETDALAKMNLSTNFIDSGDIPSWAKGYISVAYEIGLIRGYEDGSFQPNRIVSRAEMAALLDKVEKLMSHLPPMLSEGTVVQSQGSTISLLENGNQLTSFTISADLQMFVEGRVSTPIGLKPQSKVRYVVEGTEVKYLEVVEQASATANSVKGEILLANLNQGFVTITTLDGSLQTYAFAPSIKVLTLLGQELNTSSLTPGTKVQIQINIENKASQILLEEAGSKGSEGTIVELNLASKIMVLSNNNQQYLTFKLGDSVNVEFEGQRFTSLQDLRKGDLIKVDTDSSNAVTKIVLVKPLSNIQLNGSVSIIDREKRLLTFKDSNGLYKAYELPSSTIFEFSNGSLGTIDDLQAQDAITVNIKDGTVEKILLNKSGGLRGLWGKVVSTDRSRNLVIIKDKQDVLQSYETGDNLFLDIEGVTNPDIDDIIPDSIVDFELENGKIVYLKISNSVKGIVTRVDPERNLLTIKDDAGITTNYNIEDTVDIEIFRRSSEDLTDISVDDQVKLRMQGSNVERVLVESKLVGVVVDTSSSSKRIYIEDEDEYERSYDISNSLRLVVPGKSSPAISDVVIGDGVIVSYFGDTPELVTIHPVIRGEVTSLDTSRDRFVIRSYDGGSKTLTTTSKLRIEKYGDSYHSLSSVTAGDHVKVISDDNGIAYKIFIARKVTGVITGINRSTKEIYFTSNQLGYLVEPDTFIHKNGVKKSFEEIQLNQTVNIYYTTGLMAMEVELVD